MSVRIVPTLATVLTVLATEPASRPDDASSPILLHRGRGGIEVLFLSERPGEANCYAVVDPAARKAAIIDPGLHNGARMSRCLEPRGIVPAFVLITHAHPDHLGGLNDFLRRTSAVVVAHRLEAERFPPGCRPSGKDPFGPPPRRFLFRTDEQVVEFGRVRIRTLLVPGHTLASLAYELIGEDLVFAGDTVFRGSIGRTDLPDSAGEACLVAYIRDRILTLDDRARILPGHGPMTRVERERALNPYLADRGGRARGAPARPDRRERTRHAAQQGGSQHVPDAGHHRMSQRLPVPARHRPSGRVAG